MKKLVVLFAVSILFTVLAVVIVHRLNWLEGSTALHAIVASLAAAIAVWRVAEWRLAASRVWAWGAAIGLAVAGYAVHATGASAALALFLWLASLGAFGVALAMLLPRRWVGAF